VAVPPSGEQAMTLPQPGSPAGDEPSSSTEVLWMRRAGARLAVEYLERAEEWVAGVDEDIVGELFEIRRRILGRIEALNGDGKGP
jgi:hypothetical protein